MAKTVLGQSDEWILIEIQPVHGTKERFWNTSISVQKFVATVGAVNTANVCIAPNSNLSAASGVGILLSNSGDSPYPYAFDSAPLSTKGNEDLKDWWVDPCNSNLTLNIIAKKDS